MPRIAHIEIRSDPPQVAGSVVRHIIAPQGRGPFTPTYALNGESRATLTLPTDAEAWEHVRRMDCLRVVYEDGSARSWRIADDSLFEDERTGELALSCCEILLDLADVRLLRNEATLGAPQLVRPFAQMAPAAILADLLAELHDVGEALHIRLGTVEPTVLIPHERAWTSALEVVRSLAAHPLVACEYRLREEADAFYLDLLSRIGSAAPPVHVWYRHDLGRLRRERAASQLASAVFGKGVADSSGAEATAAFTTFRVTAVAGSTVTVEDPEAGSLLPMIAYDGEFNGAYAIRPSDTAACLVTDTIEATQQLVITGGSGFAVGDEFELRRTAGGDHLAMRVNPAAAASRSAGGVGRIERVVQVEASRGERNYLRNPFFRVWPSPETANPAGWSYAGPFNASKADAGAPAGTSLYLRGPFTPRRATVSAFGGETTLPLSGVATCLLGDRVWVHSYDPDDQFNTDKLTYVQTVTVTNAGTRKFTPPLPPFPADRLGALFTISDGRVGGPAGVTFAAGLAPVLTGTFRVPPGVNVVSAAAEVSAQQGTVTISYRKNGGAWTDLTSNSSSFVVRSFLGIAVVAGDVIDFSVTRGGNQDSPGALVRWAYVGPGAEIPPALLGVDFQIPEHSHANRIHHASHAALMRMAPDRASYSLDLADVGSASGDAVPADRFTLGGEVVVHHDRLASPIRARLLSLTDPEHESDHAQLSLDSAEPDLARTLARLIGRRG